MSHNGAGLQLKIIFYFYIDYKFLQFSDDVYCLPFVSLPKKIFKIKFKEIKLFLSTRSRFFLPIILVYGHASLYCFQINGNSNFSQSEFVYIA